MTIAGTEKQVAYAEHIRTGLLAAVAGTLAEQQPIVAEGIDDPVGRSAAAKIRACEILTNALNACSSAKDLLDEFAHVSDRTSPYLADSTMAQILEAVEPSTTSRRLDDVLVDDLREMIADDTDTSAYPTFSVYTFVKAHAGK
jgi:hypothetical protein